MAKHGYHTTVSRVINNNYPVKEETEKVEEAIKELNFKPTIRTKPYRKKYPYHRRYRAQITRSFFPLS